MKEKFNIDKTTLIIGKRDDGALLATNQELYSLDKAIIMTKKGKQLSPILPIGTLTKFDYWEEANYYYLEGRFDIVKDSLLGFAVGDAFGVPVEFMSRNQIRKMNINSMLEYGTHNVPKGSWSDDTSMLIAGMDAITKDNGDINYSHVMDNYMDWLYKSKYTSLDKTFGVGNIVYKSLKNYSYEISPLDCGGKDIHDNGNGSLMRILPFSLYCIAKDLDEEQTYEIISNSSKITHAHEISIMSCYIYTEFLKSIIHTKNKEKAYRDVINLNYNNKFSEGTILAHKRIIDGSLFMNIEDSIKESGYVVDTLESVLYCIIHTDNFKDSIISAINLGYDTDTVAGITGSISGILYGYDNIPEDWLNSLKKRDYLEEIALEYTKILENISKKNNFVK